MNVYNDTRYSPKFLVQPMHLAVILARGSGFDLGECCDVLTVYVDEDAAFEVANLDAYVAVVINGCV